MVTDAACAGSHSGSIRSQVFAQELNGSRCIAQHVSLAEHQPGAGPEAMSNV